MWVRIAGAILVTLLVTVGCEFLDIGGGQDDAHDAAHRGRELFWMLIFCVVMATAVLAAMRRWTEHARHAVIAVRRRPRH